MSNKGKFFKICCISAMLVSTLWAKNIVNGISVIVNGEPITLYEIHKLSKQMNVSLDEAVKNLIEKRLQDSQIKKLGIQASDFEINQKIDAVADKNGINSFELLDFVRSKGISESQYRKNIADAIKNEKLFKRIFSKSIPTPTNSEIESFYNANKAMFSDVTSFEVSRYKGSTYTALQEIQNSPMSVVPGVVVDQKNIHVNDVDKKTAYYLNQTQEGKFTPILKNKDGSYVMYLMGSKNGSGSMSLQQARPLILKELAKRYEGDIIKNYFDKLKAGASIQVLREP